MMPFIILEQQRSIKTSSGQIMRQPNKKKKAALANQYRFLFDANSP